MRKRFLLLFIVGLLIAVASCACADGDEVYTDGWHIIETNLCYYENNVRQTGILALDNNTYFFDDNGILQGNGKVQTVVWHQTTYPTTISKYYFIDNNNSLASGWQTISGKTYYFDPENFAAVTGYYSSGTVLIGETRYVFDDSGVLQQNSWYNRYYGDEEGKTLEGYQEIDGNYYFFNAEGKSIGGFRTISGKLHYFVDDFWYSGCREAREWAKIGNNWYYFNMDTGEITIGKATILGREYSFQNDGSLILSQYTILPFNRFTGCVDSEGNAVSGWVEIDGKEYYSTTGTMYVPNGDNSSLYPLKTGLSGTDRGTCYFDENCVLQKSQFIEVDGNMRYFGANGAQCSGWTEIYGDTYYFSPAMYTGVQWIYSDNSYDYYYFDDDGKLQKDAIVQIDGAYYYFDENGRRYSGWLERDGWLYYFTPRAYANGNYWLTKDDEYSLYVFDEQGRGKLEEHVAVVDPAVEPTCTASGLTEGSHCSVCNKVLVEQKVIPAKGHQYKLLPAVEETCTDYGWTAGFWCPVCGSVFVAQEPISPHGHEWGELVFEWNLSQMTVSAVRYCTYDPEHKEEALSVLMLVDHVAPTENEAGYAVYHVDYRVEPFDELEDLRVGIPALKEMQIISLPEGTKIIESEAFMNSACEAVIVNDACERIYSRAFYGCKNLKYVSVSRYTIVEENAFADCPDAVILYR